ncbi:MAG: hypothetical protein ACJ8GN_22825 [Longimicrobiaceae bacterium]
MRSTLLTLAALAAAAAGCEQREATGAIPRQRFVLANAELRSIPDTVRGDSVRRAALRKHRVSEAELRRFVDVHARSPEYMADVWREIADSVQKRWERTFPTARQDGPPPGVGIPGQPSVATMPPASIPVGPPQGTPTVIRGGEVRKPPQPDHPPPPVTEPPRPMVREVPPVRRPPARAPDTNGPMTRPGRRPLAPLDTLDRR